MYTESVGGSLQTHFPCTLKMEAARISLAAFEHLLCPAQSERLTYRTYKSSAWAKGYRRTDETCALRGAAPIMADDQGQSKITGSHKSRTYMSSLKKQSKDYRLWLTSEILGTLLRTGGKQHKDITGWHSGVGRARWQMYVCVLLFTLSALKEILLHMFGINGRKEAANLFPEWFRGKAQ